MGIQIISISHKIAPLHVREMFAFTGEQQKHMMQEITEHLEVSECIVLSTCNRTEMYVYSDSESKGCVFNLSGHYDARAQDAGRLSRPARARISGRKSGRDGPPGL